MIIQIALISLVFFIVTFLLLSVNKTIQVNHEIESKNPFQEKLFTITKNDEVLRHPTDGNSKVMWFLSSKDELENVAVSLNNFNSEINKIAANKGMAQEKDFYEVVPLSSVDTQTFKKKA